MVRRQHGNSQEHITKHIFVTGGVVSSLGKGLTASSLGRLLRSRGIHVLQQKLDPYINVDPGTMNPFQHGEVYVTEDGAETDLDIGHYERFLDVFLSQKANVTTGQIYQEVLRKERAGEYLGQCVQVIPHITNEIKSRMRAQASDDVDVIITEIGGTVGDIESQPFLEAAREVRRDLGAENCMFVHVSLVPYIAAAHELKTKPTQHSVKELQSVGIQPDILVLRTEHELSTNLRKKVALFCNVDESAVIQSMDMPTIYEVPLRMQEQKLDVTILEKMGLPVGETPTLGPWRDFLNRRHNATEKVKIGLVGKYDLQDAYKSILEALSQAATYNDRKADIHFINSENLTEENIEEKLKDMDGVIICPGFGQRGIEGKFIAIKYCRTHNVPTFGICLGMQCMAIEFARDVLGYADANSREMDEKTPHNVIDIMEEQKSITNMGGTMRLGAYECVIDPTSKTYQAYQSEHIQERHRHRYEFNNSYKEEFEKAGMKCVGINPESDLVEIIEIPTLKWFIGTQFHPEYSSTVLKPHPLFLSFIKAAINK